MTIKELEERTGMTRANIRYYENEGLLHPARLANGYRDYSEADVSALEKIKLLRQLHLDLETIRAVQSGALPLERALFTQLTKLEGDRDAADRAAQVCRALEQSGVEYAALEPEPWLRELSRRPAVPAPPKPTPQKPWWEGKDRACDHPFLRLFARVVDECIHGVVFAAVILLVFRWDILHWESFAAWLLGLFCVAFELTCEVFWLHFAGWTPGKRIFGLKVRDWEDGKLPMDRAAARSLRIFGYEVLLRTPIVMFFAMWKIWKRYSDGAEMTWDEADELHYTKEKGLLPGLTAPVICAACVELVLVMSAASVVPPNRGPLTAEEYSKNFNYSLKHTADVDGLRLNSEGDWVREYTDIVVTPFSLDTEYSPVSMELTDGVVTSVTLSDYLVTDAKAVSGSSSAFLYMDQTYYQVAALALAAATRELNCFSWPQYLDVWEDRYDSFEADVGGLHISQTVECTGFDGLGWVREGSGPEEDRSYCRTVTISLIGDD